MKTLDITENIRTAKTDEDFATLAKIAQIANLMWEVKKATGNTYEEITTISVGYAQRIIETR